MKLSGRTAREQQLIGATLGRAHRALAGLSVEDASRFHWVELRADHLRVRDWILVAVADAVSALDAIPAASLAHGLLHTDPAPEAFRFDAARGVCGLIDWDRALVGPLLYDLASAVMYVGGPGRAEPLLDAYLEDGVLPRSEVDRALEPMLRFRYAVQADYFARRIANADLTGIQEPAENDVGLEDARQWLIGTEH